MNLSLDHKAFLAKLAYEPDMNIITKQLRVMFGLSILDIEYIYVERTDTEGFIFRYDNTCVVFFSGTESLKDLWHDAIFIPSKYRGGYLHSGFKNITELINKPVCYAVKNLFRKDPVKEISAGGHSLGASISLGACDCICDKHDAETHISTWGCPNGWSKGARESFNERHPNTVNYINPGDYVTWLLGITTGRPGKDKKLSGKWGHSMDKYMWNVKQLS